MKQTNMITIEITRNDVQIDVRGKIQIQCSTSCQDW